MQTQNKQQSKCYNHKTSNKLEKQHTKNKLKQKI